MGQECKNGYVPNATEYTTVALILFLHLGLSPPLVGMSRTACKDAKKEIKRKKFSYFNG